MFRATVPAIKVISQILTINKVREFKKWAAHPFSTFLGISPGAFARLPASSKTRQPRQNYLESSMCPC